MQNGVLSSQGDRSQAIKGQRKAGMKGVAQVEEIGDLEEKTRDPNG